MTYLSAVGGSRTDDWVARTLRATVTDRALADLAARLAVSVRVETADGREVATARPAPGSPSSNGSGGPDDPVDRAQILIRGEVVGQVTTSPEGPQPANRSDRSRIAALVSGILERQLALEMEARELTTELLDRYEEVNLLYDLTEALGAMFDVPSLCDIAVDRAIRAARANRAFVATAGPDAWVLEVAAARGYRGGSERPKAGPLSQHVFESGQQVLLHAGQGWPGEDGPDAREAMLSVPLIAAGIDGPGDSRALGVLTLVGRAAGERYSAGDARLATTIATELASAVQRSRMVDAQRQAERAQQEVEIAARIQAGLLPSTPPEVPGIDLAGRCAPAASVGGDYFDIIVGHESRVTLVVADVAGHSIGSALMMAIARTVLRREVLEGHRPATVLWATNSAMIHDLQRAGLFITAFCAQYDIPSRQLRYASAAHNRPLVRRGADRQVFEIDADGMPLGILDNGAYEEHAVQLAEDDVVLLFTDGVVEARDDAGDQFGDRRLHDVLVTGAPSAGQLVDGIFAAVRRHHGNRAQQDDVTLLALRVTG